MNLSRRGFLGSLAAAGAASAFGAGTCCTLAGCKKGQVAVQLYSIHKYIPTVGLEKALAEVAKIGYKGVEFAGYYGKSAAELKKMLNDNGLVGCGTHVGRDAFSPANVKRTCEFNLGYGNTTIICPGGGNFPKKGENLDDFLKMLVDYYNTAAEEAAKYGCKIGLHNHTGEFTLKMKDGTTYWDYFFSNTHKNVCMEQDVGWTTCAVQEVPAPLAHAPREGERHGWRREAVRRHPRPARPRRERQGLREGRRLGQARRRRRRRWRQVVGRRVRAPLRAASSRARVAVKRIKELSG